METDPTPTSDAANAKLSHLSPDGAARMVDVSKKPVTARTAIATGTIRMLPATLELIRGAKSSKGDVLQIARLAGIMAAKRTADLIPLCHSIPLTAVTIEFVFSDSERLQVSAAVNAEHKTGVEMEALTAVAVAALTVYDMCKAVDRAMTVESIQLVEKSGGSSGRFRRGQE